MLSKRQVMNMKWRTLFMAAAILALFYVGPSLKVENECKKSSRGRLGRNILAVGDGQSWEHCDKEVDVFKRELKRFFKNADDPEAVEVICGPTESGKSETKAVLRECKAHFNGSWTLTVDSNTCRTLTYNCSGTFTNGTAHSFEPPEVDDPMFPPDVFTDEQRANGGFLLHTIGVLYMFYALALVCDHYFVPSLDVIIEKFDISPDVAGATLMAAGGSAPELFTSIIGVFIAVSDVGIGTIVGSAVFNVLFVIAACAFASAKALDLTAWPLIRDTTFYSIALMMLVGFFGDDTIEWWEALILFAWYFCYVGFMKFNGILEGKFLEKFPSLKGKEHPEEDNADNKDSNKDKARRQAGFKVGHRKPLLALMRGKVENNDGVDVKAGVGMVGLKETLTGGEGDKLKEDVEEERQETESNHEEEEPYKDYIRAGPGDDILSKVMWVVSLPLMVPMWITIPDPQDKKRQNWFPVSFLFSICWIAAFSYLMVWWATLVGDALGISDAVMGLTFLAAGTSVPDLITSVLVAKEGKGDMAVSSSIGSNLFDVTVGLPLPWLIFCAVNQKAIDVNSTGMGCNIAMLFAMLLIVFISILAFKWKMTKVMGGIMLVLYCIFVVVSLGLSECWFACNFLG